ncbi:protein draper-like isoform X2 [Pomacea canaliculata]|uniref:protein draper-like isoform X2 n=1 Tax=Pomacea canaliculata TaxID=400727 RepID=UPI000D734443|nr:protein draper-like isoform X2 [Pomacea canaliculata]
MYLTCPSDSSATYLLSFLALSGYIHFFAQGDVCSCQTYGGCNACLSPDACTIINVALGKPTNISSLYSNGGYNQVSGPPCLAVNGNTGSTFKPINTNSDSPACVHTADGDLFPFWEVDLGQQHVITNVTVYGRDEIDRNMLRNAKVTVDNKLCYTFAPDYHRPIATEITCNPPLVGRKVRIQKDNDTSLPFLALCQVQVWVCNNNYYGFDCTNTCGNCSGGTCQPWSGECPRGCSAGYQTPGCEAGYQPPLCKEFCTNDSYGLNCSNTCGNCSEGTSCNPVSGECPLGCNPGYQGTHCNDSELIIW